MDRAFLAKQITMKSFKFEITMKVADCWIEDGFGAANMQEKKELEERIEEVIKENMLGWAYGHEFQVKVKTISAPAMKEIATLQGY